MKLSVQKFNTSLLVVWRLNLASVVVWVS